MKTYKLYCDILSPLHIGSGTEINPLSYIIDAGRLYGISFDKFVYSMSPEIRDSFEKLIDKGNFVEIRKFVAVNIDKVKDIIFSIEVSPQVESLYKTKMLDIENQLLINPFIRTEGDSIPLMPGSSIKGAIRTAIISELAKNSDLPKPRDAREEYGFESIVLGFKDGKDDPFRGIRVRDKFLQRGETIVREVKNVSRKKGGLEANNIQIICEVTHALVTRKGVSFETEMFFDDELYSTKFLSRTFSIEQVINSCKNFYKDKMEQEHKKFYKGNEVEKISDKLLSIPYDDKSFPLRLGRFSGVESITLDNYRNPKPPGKKSVWGTSRNLAERLFPMGWVKATVIEKTLVL
jgi:CRISPR-associated protein Csm5